MKTINKEVYAYLNSSIVKFRPFYNILHCVDTYVSLSGSQPVMDGEVCAAPVEDVEGGLLQSCCWGGGGGGLIPPDERLELVSPSTGQFCFFGR
jgi:hypothetical protein